MYTGVLSFVLIVLLGVLMCIKIKNAYSGRDMPVSESKELLRETVAEVVYPHLMTLVRKKHQLTHVNDYGQKDYARWEKEKDYFIKTVIMSNINHYFRNKDNYSHISYIIDHMLLEEEYTKDMEDPVFNNNMGPLEYEYFCCEQFKKHGWNARLTKVTGDQGADIIASNSTYNVVVQCKLYSSNVGNKAVQEVYSARRYQDADHAIVISNAGYTTSAKELAHSLKVLLLHHDQIPDIPSFLSAL